MMRDGVVTAPPPNEDSGEAEAKNVNVLEAEEDLYEVADPDTGVENAPSSPLFPKVCEAVQGKKLFALLYS